MLRPSYRTALSAGSASQVVRATGLPEYHFSAPMHAPSGMRFRNPGMFMGSAPPGREFTLERTDPALVRATIVAAG
jgi:copper homeostasis protein CutC